MRNLKLSQHFCGRDDKLQGAEHIAVQENTVYIATSENIFMVDTQNSFEVSCMVVHSPDIRTLHKLGSFNT